MARKHFFSSSLRLRIALLALVVALPAGCGFQLRGAFEYPAHLEPVHVQPAGKNALADALREQIGFAQVQFVDEPDKARSILRLLSQETASRVLSVDKRGKLVEVELFRQAEFDLVDDDRNEILPRQTVQASRSYFNPDTEVLGRQDEASLIRSEITRDLAIQILRRVRAQTR